MSYIILLFRKSNTTFSKIYFYSCPAEGGGGGGGGHYLVAHGALFQYQNRFPGMVIFIMTIRRSWHSD